MATRRRSRLEQTFVKWNAALRDTSRGYKARRPHRSFKRTFRRDYTRSFALPGYIGLTQETLGLIGRNGRLFGSFFIVYTVASALILGVISQTNYAAITEALRTASPDLLLRTATIFGAAVTGGLNPTTSTNAGALSSLLIILAWLTLIWLLRHVVSKSPVTLREGLYNAGAPLIPSILVALVAVVQCIPLILVAVGYAAATQTGLLQVGVEAMLFFGAAALLATLSLYWLVSTFIALVIVTLPGMYPVAALRAAGDLVVGRRLRLIFRILWLALTVLVLWAFILIPMILLDNWLTVTWLPIVPLTVLGLTTLTLIITSTYIYLLYRKLVDDEAKPA